jgi:nucleoside-diphosphate-sugar epimerase
LIADDPESSGSIQPTECLERPNAFKVQQHRSANLSATIILPAQKSSLAETRALVVAATGASGFIARRLLRMLAEEPGIGEIRALSRRGGSARLRVGLDDTAALTAALAGCDVLVHCAFDQFDPEANLRIAASVAEACVANGTRLIHVSTAAIYEPLPDGVLDEASPALPSGDSYKDTKLAVEATLRGWIPRGLSLVVLQPTIVYGPHGGAWTDGPVRELLAGGVVLPGDGTGLCNAVYVDDVCRAVIGAFRADAPSGTTCLVSGPAPVEWRAFLGAYRDMLGRGTVTFRPRAELGQDFPVQAGPQRSGLGKRLVARVLGTDGRLRLLHLVQRLRRKLRGERLAVPSGARLALYAARCRVSTEHARAMIGYVPQIDLQAGMEATAPYVRATFGETRSPHP